jgi:branched-chain amino acid transport system permease protein
VNWSDVGQQLVNGLAYGAIIALIALGYTMVYGVLKLINFAHSDIFMVGAYIAYYAGRNFFTGSPILTLLIIFLLAMIGCSLLGLTIERFAYRPLRNAPRLNSLITAIGVSFLLEYGGQIVLGADVKTFPPIIPVGNHEWHGISFTNNQIIVICTAAALMLGLEFIVFRTRLGRAMRAVSFSFDNAALLGIPVDFVVAVTFVIGSSLAGAGGLLYAATYTKMTPIMGTLPGLKAFVAAVLGGIGNVTGAMLGGLLIGVTETFFAAFPATSQYREGVAFVILIIVLLFKPEGIMGKAVKEKV